MKILWLAPIPLIDDTMSHPAPWIITLATSLINKNIEITILNYNSELKSDIYEYTYKNINLIYVKSPIFKVDFLTLYQLRIYKVRNVLKKIISKFDMVHVHGTEHQYEAMIYGLHDKVLISIQGIMTEYVKVLPIENFQKYLSWKLSSFYEKVYIKKFHNFSCRTDWDSGFIKKYNKNAKVYMIWEMIREEFFNDFSNMESSTLLFIGGKNPIKGLKELLIAYENSLQKLELKLIVLGNCTTPDILTIIDENNLFSINVNNIECRGMQNSIGITEAYKESFCLVHPTYIDNSPNSICEAQLSGLPVIATNVGGVSSLIEDNISGILVNKTIVALEEGIVKLFNNKKLWIELSSNAKELTRKRHNNTDITNQTIQTYKQIIGN